MVQHLAAVLRLVVDGQAVRGQGLDGGTSVALAAMVGAGQHADRCLPVPVTR